MKPRALVLDFGGVISRTLFETHALSEQALGLPPGTLGWRGPFDSAHDALWRRMQAGDISERDYWMARTREVGRRAARVLGPQEGEQAAASRGGDQEIEHVVMIFVS